MLKKTIFITLSALCFVAVVQGGTVKECEDKMAASLKPKLCEVRQYKLFESQDMYNHIDCCMKALDFVNNDGSGDYHKLYDSLKEIDQANNHDQNLEMCVGESDSAQANQRAYAYYKCLLKSTSANAFKKAFDLKELINAGVLPQGSKYSPKVNEEMKKIDDNLC
ncbi:37 kDa salivary gland allergen Aed a 2-like [Anopheles maculipalpis]|uniref:37 kDa salivary gland allergen Aed a 2-like n=1 Tax=Anopheles maculipalpis TaxID=1496333 RepID=UPI002158C11F|nr:37 kDa salivary gland allergen Aed a 2-like [Anopheles maculipalpis]